MINHHGSWLPSITLGLPILMLFSLGALLAVAISARGLITWKPKTPYEDRLGWVFGTVLSGLALTGIMIGGGFGYYPYGGDYHRLQPATGTVSAIDSRFLAASQYVVVTYSTGQIVRCDDSRCATLKPGDNVRLLCTKEHQFGSPQSADGWSCRWGQTP